MTRNKSKSGEEEITNRELLNKLNDLQESVNFISKCFEDMKNENKELKKQLQENKKHNEILEERVKVMEHLLEKKQREKIKNNIVIKGVDKKSKNEEPTEIAKKIFNKLNTKIESYDIISATRKDSQNENSPIIVELKTEELKNDIIKARRTIGSITTKECSLQGTNNEIYINEQLTNTKNNLFYKARELKKEFKFKHLWTRDGNIYARKTDTSSKIKINTYTDLEKLK